MPQCQAAPAAAATLAPAAPRQWEPPHGSGCNARAPTCPSAHTPERPHALSTCAPACLRPSVCTRLMLPLLLLLLLLLLHAAARRCTLAAR